MAISRGDRTLPVVDLDGGRIIDSTAIIAALEAHQPEPAPWIPRTRRSAVALWSSRTFSTSTPATTCAVSASGSFARHLDYGLDFMTTDQPMIKARVARVRLRLAFPVVWRYMNRRYDFTEEAVERSRGRLAAALDRIESERNGRDYLVGESFTVADLTASALLYPMVWPPEFPYDLPEPRRWEFFGADRDHPALEWIRETWRRHRGTSAAV